jgi:hypothetical protein
MLGIEFRRPQPPQPLHNPDGVRLGSGINNNIRKLLPDKYAQFSQVL